MVPNMVAHARLPAAMDRSETGVPPGRAPYTVAAGTGPFGANLADVVATIAEAIREKIPTQRLDDLPLEPLVHV